MNTELQQTYLAEVNEEEGRSEVLAWDGRLDNREDLLRQLSGPAPSDTSNQSLVLAVYERWGTDGFVRLIGDWSIVIRDPAKRRIVLASDFAGVRPLYYHLKQGRLLWSARLQSLLKATGIDELDEKYVAGFVAFGGCPNHTPYKGIYSVPPGHALCVTANDATAHPFWALPVRDSIRYRNESRYDEQLRGLFQEAVAVRIQTDAPVFAELSGGLDSSSVVCMANRLIRRGSVAAPRLVGVSYVWQNSLDEPFLREVEKFCGIDGIHLSTHDNRLLTDTEAGNAMPEGFERMRLLVAAAAGSLNTKVFLTGQNGDLVMGNWLDDSMQVAKSLRRLHLTRACREAFAWSKLLRVPVSGIVWRALQTALSPSLTSSTACMLTDGSYLRERAATLLLPAFCKRTGLADSGGFFSTSWMDAPPERRNHFQALARLLELRTLQAPEPFQHLDYTHPFAHRPLVEFLMAIPADVLCGPGEPRRLMRRALSDLWPDKLRTRRSKGLFNGPWFEALRPLALELLNSKQIEVIEREIVDCTSFLSRLKRLSAGIDCNDSEVRQLIVLEFWLRSGGLRRLSQAELRAA